MKRGLKKILSAADEKSKRGEVTWYWLKTAAHPSLSLRRLALASIFFKIRNIDFDIFQNPISNIDSE